MFTYNGVDLDYFDHRYNSTRRNERAVEIPIARLWIAEHGIDLEVGNVLGHYGHTGHRVVDRYEPGAENIDVFDIHEPARSVVSISTLEHVRWDEPDRDPWGAVAALEHLQHLADQLLVTIPMGHHPLLDEHLLGGAGATSAVTLVRVGDGWKQTDELEWRPYGVTTKWAGSVWIGEWLS